MNRMTRMTCGAAQFHHRPGDKTYNLAVVERFVEEARGLGVKVLACPEMCVTGYWHATKLGREGLEALAEPVPDGPSTRRLRDLAASAGMAVGAGLIERGEDGRLFNTYVVCLPDGAVHRHRKIHAFESEHISAGDRYTVFDTPWGVRLGVLICYDNNIVENVRATALLGADVLLAPHQTGGCDSRSPHAMGLIDPALWDRRETNPAAIEAEFRGPKGREWLLRWLPSRAHDNGMFLIFSNGVGEDAGEVRTGNAMILDPYGRILAETWKAEDRLVVADLDLDLLPLATGRRWIRGRRPELYGPLTEPLGHELDPRSARFSRAPVSLTGRPCQGDDMTTAAESNDVAKALIEGALSAFRANKGWADKAIAQLPDEKLHQALDPNTNSVAVIMKHVAGNLLSRWTDFLTTDGEKPWRDRDDEFVDTFASREELLACWESGWHVLFDSLTALTAADVARTVTIRGEPHGVPLAVQRSLAHCGYHVGQIILIARVLAGDEWTTITIPRGGSSGFNQRVWGQGHYKPSGA